MNKYKTNMQLTFQHKKIVMNVGIKGKDKSEKTIIQIKIVFAIDKKTSKMIIFTCGKYDTEGSETKMIILAGKGKREGLIRIRVIEKIYADMVNPSNFLTNYLQDEVNQICSDIKIPVITLQKKIRKDMVIK